MRYLLLDMNNLSHRAFHSTGTVTTNGVLFGVFREILALRKRFSPCVFCFCFDVGESKRKEIYPAYKQKPLLMGDSLGDLRLQIKLMREQLLEEMGFANVFGIDGYEADDLIASIGYACEHPAKVTMVSSDKDLYQCLNGLESPDCPANWPNISIWKPIVKEEYGMSDFVDEYGINPGSWPMIKAMMGDVSDNIPGIEGVGIKKAIKFLGGKLSKGKIRDRIRTNPQIIERNLKLVTLPFPSTPRLKVKETPFNERKWNAAVNKLGMSSLEAK
jgi:5'-3' exonuclease